MEEIAELVRKYHLEEDIEHIIIPQHDAGGRACRCHLLKRRMLRIQFPDGHFEDFPLSEIIEATVQYPDMPLRDSLQLVTRDPEASAPEEGETKDMKETEDKEI